jgi:hypothetical protein
MILISHRGNFRGPNPEKENTPDYILGALGRGFDVEVDVWVTQDAFFLGHDKPEHLVEKKFLADNRDHLWIHCKNIEALEIFNSYDGYKYFWHQNDDCCLVSNRVIWHKPNPVAKFPGINLMPEFNKLTKIDLDGAQGVCSDYIERYV